VFGQSPAEAISGAQQVGGAKKTMITLLLTARKLIVLDVRPEGHKYNHPYFVDYVFPDLRKANLSFHRRMPDSTFWVHMGNSMCHNRSKVMSKSGKHYLSRFSHPPYSLAISQCNFWLFGVLKGILKDQEFNSSNEIEQGIPRIWDDLNFGNVQGVFQNRMSRLVRVIENGGEHAQE
jgi:hypothetical protein